MEFVDILKVEGKEGDIDHEKFIFHINEAGLLFYMVKLSIDKILESH